MWGKFVTQKQIINTVVDFSVVSTLQREVKGVIDCLQVQQMTGSER